MNLIVKSLRRWTTSLQTQTEGRVFGIIISVTKTFLRCLKPLETSPLAFNRWMRNRTDTPDLSWLLNLLLSTFCHFRSFRPSPSSCPLSRCLSVFNFASVIPNQAVMFRGSCAAFVTRAACMREPDSVWSNHCNRSHGLHPAFPNPCRPPSLSLKLLSSFFPSFPPPLSSSLDPSPLVCLSLTFFHPTIPPSLNPTTLAWGKHCWLPSLSFHCHFTTGFHQHVHRSILQDYNCRSKSTSWGELSLLL